MDLILEKKITKPYKKVMLTQSLYSLALYLYINKNIESDTLFLLGSDINYESIKSELSNFIIYDHKNAGPKNFFEWILLSRGFLFGRFKSFSKNIDNDAILYGHDHISLSCMFLTKEMIIIEDGLSNYTESYNCLTKNQKIKKFFNIPFKTKGYSERTKVIYLTGMDLIPKELNCEIKIVERVDFINAFSVILNGIFHIELNVFEKTQLLITQPLSEDNIMTEEDKIKIYSKIINPSLPLIIKPHPREVTNYKKYFERALIISNEKLIESVFSEPLVTDIFTLFSSSLINYPFNRKVNLHIKGTIIDSRLVSKYGIIESAFIKYD